MGPKSGSSRWAVAALTLVLAGAAGSMVLWSRAAPPGPDAILEGLCLRHGIALQEDRGGRAWDYDSIADEWSGLVLARSSVSPGLTPRWVELRGWRCALASPAEVDAGSIVLGSAIVATGHAGTLTQRTPDGGFQCEVTTMPGDGPHTFLLTAIPTGTIERLRFDAR